jgi:DUF2075 family protein
MQLFAGTTRDFVADATHNAITTKLSLAFFQKYRRRVSPNEEASWRNSLMQMGVAIQNGDLMDHGIVLEYELPLSSLRLDCMITGHDANGKKNAVIVELKQWSDVEASDADDCVLTFIAGAKRDVLHPSRQVGNYREYLKDVHTVFTSGQVELNACSYLHNMHFDSNNEIFLPKHEQILSKYPLFTGNQQPNLIQYLRNHLEKGNGKPVLDAVVASKFKPSKKLLEHTSSVIKGQKVYVLLDNQQVVFNKVFAQVREAVAKQRKKSIVLVRGGPGTGKSVIALRLLAELQANGYDAIHATGSKAFTSHFHKLVGTRASALFRYTHNFALVPPNTLDALIVDEAHRVREVSSSRFTPQAERSGKPQIRELIDAAKVSVFFIDDHQLVRPGEIGSAQLIRDTAAEVKANLYEYELEAQFRCGGSDGFINWIDNSLDVRTTANVLWKKNDPFEFRVFESPAELELAIREKAKQGYSARLTAGFCWPWSDPEPDGSLVSDVAIGDWQMPWNARPDGKKLAKGIPKSMFWASDPNGLDQVGCVYTAQGFEFDYVGVIFGLDLRRDMDRQEWVGDKKRSFDTVVSRSKDRFDDLIRNTYRVLLTRGMKGCYVHFMDDATRQFILSRME